MKRQLRKGGGIMAISPRENFGIGSSLKRFVRKVIPNELSEIAVKAAPFVAPFNPAAAAALSGIGTFDQTGSISDAIKSGGLNYAGGQAARYIGGAGFQGNPFEGGLQGTLQNFTTFSSPIGTDTGLGKFLSGRGTPEVQAIGAEEEALQKITDEAALKNLPAEQQRAERARQLAERARQTFEAAPKTGIFDAVKSGNIEEVGRQAFNLAKKGATQLFTKVDPTTKKRVLDKSVAIGTLAFAATYADAKSAAEDLGIDDYSESQYNEDQKLEKKQEYAKNLQNFFTGKKDGGRIGYKEGTEKEGILSVTDEGRSGVMYFDDKGNPLTKDEFLKQADEEEFRLRDQLDFLIKNKPMFEPETYKQLNRELMQKLFGDAPSIKLNEEEPIMKQEGYSLEKRATGGRIGFEKGGDDKGMIKGLLEKIGENLRYQADDFVYDEPMSLSLPLLPRSAKSKVLQNPKNREIIREKYDTLSDDKKEYIEMYLDNIAFPDDERFKDYQFKKPGKISFPIDFKQREYNRKIRLGDDYEDLVNMRNRLNISPEEYDAMTLGEKAKTRFLDFNKAKFEDFMKERSNKNNGGRIGYMMGSEVPVRTNQGGIKELDYRKTGGFVPVGIKEKADDVPAMLSKNEFVMTADAVRGIGGGSVEKGAKKLYGAMKQAEKVGRA
jgi:hypothetical protein